MACVCNSPPSLIILGVVGSIALSVVPRFPFSVSFVYILHVNLRKAIALGSVDSAITAGFL